jgi:MYXO-CTERM domain-containing protein
MSDRQDSFGELLARFGPPTQDTAAPTITFSSPVDGEIVDVGFVDVVVEIDDDREGYGWAVRSPLLEEPIVAYEPGQLSLTIDVAETGTFPLEATVIDQAGKRGTAVIQIQVGDADEGDSSGDGNDSDASEDDWIDYGCGCRTGGDDEGALWMLVAAVGVLRRRRTREPLR